MSTRLRVVQFFITFPWTYIYIYITVFKVQVVIWETLPTCYFHSTSLSPTPFLFFLPKNAFWTVGVGIPMTCALMVSSLRLSACFTVHSADSGTFFQFFYSIMVKRKKLWEHIFFFYSCLEWRANYLWLWIQTCYLSRFDYSTFVVLFLTSYFIVSNW